MIFFKTFFRKCLFLLHKAVINVNYNAEFVSLNELIPFPNHPYRVDINENLRNLLHSIEERGIDEPLIVRRVNDKLEIIS